MRFEFLLLYTNPVTGKARKYHKIGPGRSPTWRKFRYLLERHMLKLGCLKFLQSPTKDELSPKLQSIWGKRLLSVSRAMLCMHAKSLQSCPTLCNPTDSSPPGSSVHGILQARILEWVAVSFSNACMHAKLLQLCPTLCDLMDSSPPGFSVHGILQVRILVCQSTDPQINRILT